MEVAALESQISERQQLVDSLQQKHINIDALMLSSLQGGDMLQTIRAEMVKSAQSMANENQELQQLDEMFKQTHQALSRLDDRAVKISSQASQSSDSVQILDNTASSISRLVSTIQEISDQTNLLALNAAIEAALMIKGIFSLPLRALQGFIDSIFKLLDVPLTSPDYSCISKRSKTVQVKYRNKSRGAIRHIAIDSTGLKVFGEGEWKVKKHGAEKSLPYLLMVHMTQRIVTRL